MAKSNRSKGDIYEIAALQLMKRIQNDLGIRGVQSGQDQAIEGKSRALWHPDLVAFHSDDACVLIECRYRGIRTGGVKQSDMAAIAFTLFDTNSAGILITTKRAQKGARLVAERAKIGIIEFQPSNTSDGYVATTSNFRSQHRFLGTSDSFDLTDETFVELEYEDGSSIVIR